MNLSIMYNVGDYVDFDIQHNGEEYEAVNIRVLKTCQRQVLRFIKKGSYRFLTNEQGMYVEVPHLNYPRDTFVSCVLGFMEGWKLSAKSAVEYISTPNKSEPILFSHWELRGGKEYFGIYWYRDCYQEFSYNKFTGKIPYKWDTLEIANGYFSRAIPLK